MRYLLFGTGDCYERYKRWFMDEEVTALIDNSREKQGKELDGYQILSPEEGIQKEFDAVVILSFYVNEMRRQLEEAGVVGEKIYHFYDLHQLIDVRKKKKALVKYGDFESDGEKKKILLLNQNLSVGGPALTLFDCARILKKNGYQVVYGSMIDGPLKGKLLEEHIPVIIDENLLIGTMRDSEWVREYDMVFCNAINFYVFLSDRDTSVPMIWWLHDSEFFYEGVDRRVISRIPAENLSVYAVGNVPEKALHAYMPGIRIETLLYGVKDLQLPDKESPDEDAGLYFVTIGFVEARKGQDILVDAVMRLPRPVREQCRFYIVGKDTSVLAGALREQTKDIPELIFTGMVGDVHEYLDKADVLVCPSREDPMPAACTEAMMHEVPCIVSDAAGTAFYIKEKENGLLFQSGNAGELAEKLAWCVENKQSLSTIGKKSRRIYEREFSMHIFEKNLLDIVENII